MWAHPRNESKGTKLERESQQVMPTRLDMLDAIVGQRVMAQQGSAVRKGTVYRTLNRLNFPKRTILPLTGIGPLRITQ